MREGWKKNFCEKKNIEPIFRKVNEGDEKKQAKKNIAGKIFIISRNELGFFRDIFSLSKFNVFFRKSATI